MTLKEFFRKARRGRTWELHGYYRTVRCANGLCPLGAVAGEAPRHGLEDVQIGWLRATRILDLAPGQARRIARAADFKGSKDRPWLLKNLGIRA